MATRTSEVSPGRPEPYARAFAEPAAELGLRTFWLGVTACTTAVAVFLLVRLTAWPPHEDETLALFVGRKSLGGLFETVLDRARRRAAPLPVRVDRRAPRRRPRRPAALLGAVRGRVSIPVDRAPRRTARRPDRGARGHRARLGELDAPLPRHLRADVQPLPLHERALVPRLPGRGRERAAGGAGRSGRSRSWRRSRRTRTARSCSPRRASTYSRARAREAAFVAFAAVAVLGSPFWRSDLVLAGRFDVGVGGGGQKLDGPRAVLRYLVPGRGRLHGRLQRRS